MIATGVANPKAHGQLTTKTAIPRETAVPTSAPTASHTPTVMSAITMTAGTKKPDTRSAILAIGALPDEASLTMRMICDSVVSRPTRSARQRR